MREQKKDKKRKINRRREKTKGGEIKRIVVKEEGMKRLERS